MPDPQLFPTAAPPRVVRFVVHYWTEEPRTIADTGGPIGSKKRTYHDPVAMPRPAIAVGWPKASVLAAQPAVQRASKRRDIVLAIMRSGLVHGKIGRRPKHLETRADRLIDGYKRAIQKAWADTGEDPFEKGVPLAVEVIAWFHRIKGLRGSQPEPKPTTPDGDNLVKAIWDALLKHAYYDDNQICFSRLWKVWAPPGRLPCVEITIREITPDEVPAYPEDK
jgi:Holliday junction resolvase RusA-like endonuclease